MRRDADFDQLGRPFENEIYGSTKGVVRLHVLWSDLLTAIPRIERGGLSVLDVGGGAGHIALRLAGCCNDVLIADPSTEMLARARAAAENEEVSGRVTFLNASVQELGELLAERFDLVVCHAVLEWLAEPRDALRTVATFMKSDGRLSVMFYNRNAALLKQVLSGKSEETSTSTWGEAATPLAEDDVRLWLDDLGLEVTSKAGIRIFHDYLPAGERTPERIEALIPIEETYRRIEPFASLGQHIHLVCSTKTRASST